MAIEAVFAQAKGFDGFPVGDGFVLHADTGEQRRTHEDAIAHFRIKGDGGLSGQAFGRAGEADFGIDERAA